MHAARAPRRAGGQRLHQPQHHARCCRPPRKGPLKMKHPERAAASSSIVLIVEVLHLRWRLRSGEHDLGVAIHQVAIPVVREDNSKGAENSAWAWLPLAAN